MITTHQAHTRQESEGEREFSFWGSSNTISSLNDCDKIEGNNEASLKSEVELEESAYQRKVFKFQHSAICSTVSDPSRGKAIEQGQRELMEMMQHMPESSYELSFQHMVVVEKQVLESHPDQRQKETSLDNTVLMQSSSNKAQHHKGHHKKRNKSNSSRHGQLLRVESMDSETFLLKMFFPTSLHWMKKTTVKNGSSSRPSLRQSIKQVGKECRFKRFFVSGDNRGNVEDGLSQHNGDHNKNRFTRCIDHSSSFSHGCWPLIPYARGKTKKVGG